MLRMLFAQHRGLNVFSGAMLMMLLLAALLVPPAMRALGPEMAPPPDLDLKHLLNVVARRARSDHHVYMLSFHPQSGWVTVLRWVYDREGRILPQKIVPLTGNLPNGATVERISVINNEVIISEHGFPLSRGTIVLRAQDGSRHSVQIGER